MDYYSEEVVLNREPLQQRLYRVLNSVCMFVLAFSIIHMLNYVVNASIMSLIGYSPSINFYGIFDIPEDTASWTKKKIILSYFFGPIACLLVGLFSFRIFLSMDGFFSIIKVFFLWLGILGISQFLSNLVTSALGTNFLIPQFYYNYAVIFTWSYITPVFAGIFSITGLVMCFLFGYSIASYFLNLSPSARMVFYLKGRRKFILQILVLPTILGGLFVIWLGFPFNVMKQIASLLTLVLIIIGVLIRTEMKSIPLKIYKMDVLNFFPLIPGLIVVALYFVVKIVLKDGISIQY